MSDAELSSPPSGSQVVATTVGHESVTVGDKKLLMFSDIEGCQADGKYPQSTALCKPEFYAKIAEMLEDKNVHVAFLGDYFDQGMHVHSSITGLKMLLDNKDFGSRVYVILGNRDVNKLRFCYEIKNLINMSQIQQFTTINLKDFVPVKETKDDKVSYTCPKFDKGWNAWNAYYYGLFKRKMFKPNNCNLGSADNTNEIDLVKHILETSMGANKIENGKMTGLYSFMPFEKIATADDSTALIYLKSALGIPLNASESKPDDALDVLGFFSKCKLAHVFEGKVLLAHGGGFDPEAFFDENYVKSFFETNPNYPVILEKFRKRLSVTNDEVAASISNITVQGSVELYNTLLQEVLSEIQTTVDKGGLDKPSWKFILLQALGLKPDEEDARYKSLIQSCSQDGCSGKNPDLQYDPSSTKLKEVLSRSGITHVSYGHKPVCFPIPLIYQRSTIEGVTFISNDTSNAKRTIKEIGENTVVGTSITFKSDSVETQVELITLDGKESPASKYSDMFGPYSKDNQPPVYVEEKDKETTLSYKGHKLLFNNLYTFPPDLRAFNLLKYEEDTPAAAAAAVAGGRRRSRNRKRNTKRVSRYISKRTRRNKQTRRGRKIRKY
jgi:hypothetical protein